MIKRFYLGFLFLVVMILGSVFYVCFAQKSEEKIPEINGTFLPNPIEVNPFHLMDHTGKAFTQKNLKGHWTLLFFGFTHCGMVCPMTMSALNKMYHILEQQLPPDQLPQVVMITVDPERDSVLRMHEYIIAFNSHFTGVTGDISEIVSLEKQFHIAAAKMVVDGKGPNHYTINHSAEILVFNPDGNLEAYLSYPHEPNSLAKDYRTLLGVPFKPSRERTIVSFLASWCEMCREEIPELNHFYQHNQNKNIFLYGYNVDNPASNDLPTQFPILSEQAIQKWNLGEVEGVPTTFILDADGHVLRKISGPVTEELLSQLVA